MQIANNYNAQSFKRLDYSEVCGDGLKLVRKELPQLRKLAKDYDIKLSTGINSLFDSEYVSVFVNHVNKKPSFLERLFSFKGYSICQIDTADSIMCAVKKAIATLK